MLDANEIEALNSIIQTLDGLQPDSRGRIMLYLRGRLDAIGTVTSVAVTAKPTLGEKPDQGTGTEKRKIVDIRQLRSDKSPRSDVEMAALVGYYLQEEAPEAERKTTLDRADLEKYFKQAGHPLPNRLAMTLTNAKNAGYLDVVGQGEYRLNAVGYNLVAHNLPATGAAGRSGTSKRTSPRKLAKKSKEPLAKARPSTVAAKPVKKA